MENEIYFPQNGNSVQLTELNFIRLFFVRFCKFIYFARRLHREIELCYTTRRNFVFPLNHINTVHLRFDLKLCVNCYSILRTLIVSFYVVFAINHAKLKLKFGNLRFFITFCLLISFSIFFNRIFLFFVVIQFIALLTLSTIFQSRSRIITYTVRTSSLSLNCQLQIVSKHMKKQKWCVEQQFYTFYFLLFNFVSICK